MCVWVCLFVSASVDGPATCNYYRQYGIESRLNGVCVCACVKALVQALPELLPMIQTHLLDLLSLGLTHKPYRENLPTATAHSLAQAIQLGEGRGSLLQPAL